MHDRFHVSKHLNEEVDKVRRDEYRRLLEKGDDPKLIGVVAASAGANLVLNLIIHPDAVNPKDADVLERPGCQVPFAVMLCPWPTPANRPAMAVITDAGDATDKTVAASASEWWLVRYDIP